MKGEEHHERENYFRHSILVVDHSKDALNSLIDKDLREKNITFENFLDQKKHEIYHCCFNEKCCKCLIEGTPPPRRTKRLTNVQFYLLYDKKNKPYCGIKKNISHLCCIDVKSGISIEIIEITLSRWLLVNYCNEVFWKECLRGLPLEDFLNNNKHFVYHLWQFNTSCCSCPYRFQLPSRQVINDKQFKIMFPGCSLLPASTCRKRNYMGKTNCICSMSAKLGIHESDLNPELQQKLLEIMVPARKSVETLIQIRNNTYGHIHKTRIANEDFRKISTETEIALMNIGHFCGKESQVKAAIHKVQKQPLDCDLMSNYTKIWLESIERQCNLYFDYFSLNYPVYCVVPEPAPRQPDAVADKREEEADELPRPNVTNSCIKEELQANTRQLEEYTERSTEKIQKSIEDNTRAMIHAFSEKLENIGLPHIPESGPKYGRNERRNLLPYDTYVKPNIEKFCTLFNTDDYQICSKLARFCKIVLAITNKGHCLPFIQGLTPSRKLFPEIKMNDCSNEQSDTQINAKLSPGT
ncbi:unnamed protein product [Mytilus coruscus]|uniref:DZIP3-like HEPN domain-containing protein n=1 Tax=Mytilus coruscus TaxID=42192 RepID=A0A6J8C1Q5_MYTCO|nr:unnamed protein product [Mytilus coruscus]